MEARLFLRQVHVITRHGSRRPLSKSAVNLEESTNPSETSFLTPLGQLQHYQLGEWLRERYLNNNNTDASDFGQNVLTTYDPLQAHFESSSYERTLTSAHSLALGLFPLETRGLQLIPGVPPIIPVYAQDRRNDIAIRAYDKCPAFHDTLQDLYDTQTWHQIERDAMPLLRKLAGMAAFQEYATTTTTTTTPQNNTNTNDDGAYIPLAELWNVYDAIHVARIECPTSAQVNDSSSGVCQDIMDPALTTAMERLDGEEWQNIELLAHAVELLKYGRDVAENKVGGVLWNTILQRMQQPPLTWTTNGDGTVNDDDDDDPVGGRPNAQWFAQRQRFYVTSAHYPTILGLFAALGIPFNSNEDDIIPEYASALILEVYQDDDTWEPFVKIVYKSGVKPNDVAVLVSSRCRTNLVEGCTLDEFAKALEAVRVTPEEWCGLCGNTDVDVCLQQELTSLQQSCSKDNEAGVMVGMYLAGMITAGFLVVLIHLCKRRRHYPVSEVSSDDIHHTMDQTVEVKTLSMDDLAGNVSESPLENKDDDGETKVDSATFA